MNVTFLVTFQKEPSLPGDLDERRAKISAGCLRHCEKATSVCADKSVTAIDARQKSGQFLGQVNPGVNPTKSSRVSAVLVPLIEGRRPLGVNAFCS